MSDRKTEVAIGNLTLANSATIAALVKLLEEKGILTQAEVVEKAHDEVPVTLRRTTVPPTQDLALWVLIRGTTKAIDFEQYERFIDLDSGQARDRPGSVPEQSG